LAKKQITKGRKHCFRRRLRDGASVSFSGGFTGIPTVGALDGRGCPFTPKTPFGESKKAPEKWGKKIKASFLQMKKSWGRENDVVYPFGKKKP